MKIMMAILLTFISACSPEPNISMKQRESAKQVGIQEQHRIDVTRIGVVVDDLAYGNRRGVYLIKDNETGNEYIGVSGVGISETGTHRAGKANQNDER